MSSAIEVLKSGEAKVFYAILGILFVGFVSGFGVAGGFELKEDIWDKGMFGINDIYNTCSYYTEKQGVVWEGYCYSDHPETNGLVAGCYTGCKLATPYWDEYNLQGCMKYCKDNIEELEREGVEK